MHCQVKAACVDRLHTAPAGLTPLPHHLRGIPLQLVKFGSNSKMLQHQSQIAMVLQEQSTLHTEQSSSGRPMKVPPSPFATQSKEPDKAKSKCCGCVVQ